jgi:hypothetical protein
LLFRGLRDRPRYLLEITGLLRLFEAKDGFSRTSRIREDMANLYALSPVF